MIVLIFSVFFLNAEPFFVLVAHFLVCDMLPFNLGEDRAEGDRDKGEEEEREGKAIEDLLCV